MNLESLLNNILTSGINFSDPDTIRKIKVLNVFQLVFTMLSPVLGLFYFYIGAIPLFYSCIAAGFLMAAGIGILRKTKKAPLSNEQRERFNEVYDAYIKYRESRNA